MSYPGFGSIFTLITFLIQFVKFQFVRIYCCFSQGITPLIFQINDVIIVKKVCCEIEIKQLSYKFWNNIAFFDGSRVLTEQITSNEYLSVDTKDRFNENTVLPRA